MAIADRIQSMYEHVGEVYDTISNVYVNTGKQLFDKDNAITLDKVSFTQSNENYYVNNSSTKKMLFVPINATSPCSFTVSKTSSSVFEITMFYAEPNTAKQNIINNSGYLDASRVVDNSATSLTISSTFPGTTYKTLAIMYYSGDDTLTEQQILDSIMVNEGTEALPYQPYTDNPMNKNIENIPKVIQQSYLEIMNNGIDVVWDNWEKVVGEGTSLTLNNTEQAPMKVLLKGNTYQDSTTGKNLFDLGTVPTKTDGGITFTPVYENGELQYINVNGTATANVFYNMKKTTFPAGSYIISGCMGGNTNTYALCISFSLGRIYQTNGDTTFTLNEEGTMSECFIRIGNGQTVNNVKFYPMIRLSTVTDATYEPYTNGASPNQDYPQEVHTVSGDNEVEVYGENYFNKVSGENGAIDTSGNNSFNTSNWRAKDYIEVEPNTSYTFSVENVSSYTIRLYEYTENKTFISPRIEQENNSLTITTSNNTKYLKYTIYRLSVVMTQEIINQMKPRIIKTSESTTYPINLPEGMFLGSIGDYKDRFFKTSGKNLIPFTNQDFTLNSVRYYVQNGSLYLNGTSTGETLTSNAQFKNNFSFMLKAGTYNISCADKLLSIAIKKYSDDSNIASISSSVESATFTLSEDTQVYIGFYVYQKTFNNTLIRLQLNEGTTALPYEPYGTNEWYLEKKIGKAQVSLSNTVYDVGNYKGAVFTPSILKVNSISGLAYCSKSLIAIGTSQRVDGRFYENPLNYMFIGSSTDTITELREKYDGSDFYYPVATPTYTKIEGTLASQLEEVYRAKSKEGQTNISQTNDDLPFVLSVSALSDGTPQVSSLSLGMLNLSNEPEVTEEPEVEEETEIVQEDETTNEEPLEEVAEEEEE